jgi:DNA-binding GntR family transcriptional regulator
MESTAQTGEADPSPPWPAIRRAQPLRESVREALEELVLDGVLRPGQHLAEEELAQRLGVSRNPIREGLNQLATAGFVELRPGRGAFVRVPAMREVDEVFHLRMLLEAESARLAADRITDVTLEQLRDVLELGQEAVATGDPQRLLDLNAQFHGLITDTAGNAVMGNVLRGLARRIRWYFAAVVVRRSPVSWHEHQEIFDALAARDGSAAAEIMWRHIGHSRQALRESQQYDGPPIRAYEALERGPALPGPPSSGGRHPAHP